MDLEKNKIFKAILQVYFYSILFFCSYRVICGHYLFLLYFALILLVSVILFQFLLKKKNFFDAFQDFINVIDGPFDWIKEKLHCAKLPFGYQLNISFMMKNRKTTWDIIRKQGSYSNCDPEDLE